MDKTTMTCTSTASNFDGFCSGIAIVKEKLLTAINYISYDVAYSFVYMSYIFTNLTGFWYNSRAIDTKEQNNPEDLHKAHTHP